MYFMLDSLYTYINTIYTWSLDQQHLGYKGNGNLVSWTSLNELAMNVPLDRSICCSPSHVCHLCLSVTVHLLCHSTNSPDQE
jgi:hypothetical protein